MSDTTRTILMVSAIVVFVLGIAIYIGLNIYSRKIRKKYLAKAQAEALVQIESLRSELGVLPFDIKDFLKSKANDLDIEGIINTIYQNHYQNCLIIDEKDMFPIVAIDSKTKSNIYYLNSCLNKDLYDKVKENFGNEAGKGIIEYKDQELDFVAILRTEQDINDLYDKYVHKMQKGMCIINFDNAKRPEIKRLISLLRMSSIPYEVSFLSSKFLFIVKR